MPLRIYNTLTQKKEIFKPQKAGHVRMYVCGVTPYDECHLGHARCYVVFDVIRRYLATKYRVTYVQNFTDIDDKIIQRAKERGEDPKALAERHIQDYFEKMDALNVRRADLYPRVTEHISSIVGFIDRLVKAGKAYRVNGDVYFSVRTFKRYGRLSKRSVDDLLAGARVEVDPRKEDPLDFALWKAAKPGEPSWGSPWGKGRPGWHIECSVMSTQHLGATFDVHGGGQDLIFPHHENEIAQSESGTGKPFARFWIHNGFVTINREKMSKSLGNFFTLREIFEKFPPEAVRYYLLSAHYRSPLDFSDDQLAQAQTARTRLIDHLNRVKRFPLIPACRTGGDTGEGARIAIKKIKTLQVQFKKAMGDDFNTAEAIGVLHGLAAMATSLSAEGQAKAARKAGETLGALADDVLGLNLSGRSGERRLPPGIEALLKRREEARAANRWQEADHFREEIMRRGYRVEDTPTGPRVIPVS